MNSSLQVVSSASRMPVLQEQLQEQVDHTLREGNNQGKNMPQHTFDSERGVPLTIRVNYHSPLSLNNSPVPGAAGVGDEAEVRARVALAGVGVPAAIFKVHNLQTLFQIMGGKIYIQTKLD